MLSLANQLKPYFVLMTLMINYSPHVEKAEYGDCLLKVVMDFRSCIAQDQGVISMLLDITAAFDTADYVIWLGRFASRLGI
jgi:hypothetical protein